MKSTFLGVFVIGVIVGALGLWIAGHFAHIPGERDTNYSFSADTNQSFKTSRNQPNNPASSPSFSTLSSDVPIYTPSHLVSSSSNRINYFSSSPSNSVLNYYGEMLSTNGWHILTESTANNRTTINASDNVHQISVSIGSQGQNSSVFSIQSS